VGGWKEFIVNKALQILSIALCTSSAAIAATTITFEDLVLQRGSEIETPYAVGEVSFSAVGGLLMATFTPDFLGTGLTSTAVPVQIQACIPGGADFVTVQLSKSNYDVNTTLFLKASTDNIHWESADPYTIIVEGLNPPGPPDGPVPLSFVLPNMKYVEFGTEAGLIIVESFTYGHIVPAPGALLLVAVGLTWVQGLRRKRLL